MGIRTIERRFCDYHSCEETQVYTCGRCKQDICLRHVVVLNFPEAFGSKLFHLCHSCGKRAYLIGEKEA